MFITEHSRLLWTELFQHFALPVNIHESYKKMYTASIHQSFRERSNALALHRETRNFLKLPSESAFKKKARFEFMGPRETHDW